MATVRAPDRKSVHTAGDHQPRMLTAPGPAAPTIPVEEAATHQAAGEQGTGMLAWFRSPIVYVRDRGWRALFRRRRPVRQPTLADLRAMSDAEFEHWVESSGFGQEIRDAHASAEPSH